MKIKKFKVFSESISGWELVGKHTMGPAYPEQKLPTSISSADVNVLMGDDGNFYTEDDFIKYLYPEYLSKNPGKPLDGFTEENLRQVLKYK